MSIRLTKSRSSRTSKTIGDIRPKKPSVVDFATAEIVHKINENLENLLVIYEIREELIENVLLKCYERDIKKETVSFTVKCAHKAMMEIIDLNFYVQDHGNDDLQSNEWIADQLPEPSPPDTWAASNVPTIDTRKEPVQVIPKKTPQESDDATDVITELSENSPHYSLVSEPYMSRSASDYDYSECLVVPNVSEVLIPESVTDEEDITSDMQKELSLFTQIATFYDTDPSRASKCHSDTKHKLCRLPKIPKVNEEKKIKPPEVLKISPSTLPPLRADTVLQRPQSPSINEQKPTSPSKSTQTKNKRT